MTIWELNTDIAHVKVLNGSDLLDLVEMDVTVNTAVELELLNLESDAWLDNIHVKGSKGKGLGSKLLEIHEGFCKKANVRRIVGLFAPNYGFEEDLERFYKENGYTMYGVGDSKYIYKDLV